MTWDVLFSIGCPGRVRKVMHREIIEERHFRSRNEQKGPRLRMNLACLRDHSELVWLEHGE